MTRQERAWSVLLAMACAVPFIVAAWLTPDSRGFGTHEQLHLPPCLTTRLFGLPCAFCGMTTSFAWFVRGNFAEALRCQPAGVALAVGTTLLGFSAVLASILGRIPRRWPGAVRNGWVARAVVVVLLLAWMYKVGEAISQ